MPMLGTVSECGRWFGVGGAWVVGRLVSRDGVRLWVRLGSWGGPRIVTKFPCG